MLSRWPLAVILALAGALAAGQPRPDPCAGETDALRRVECHARLLDRRDTATRGGWQWGEETDPITDAPSAVLRRPAERPVQTEAGSLVLPHLQLTCWQGREVLLHLDLREELQMLPGADCGETRAGTEVTYRIGSDPPVRRTWAAVGTTCDTASLDRHDGAMITARALAEGDPGTVLVRYSARGARQRTIRFRLDGLQALLPRVLQACESR